MLVPDNDNLISLTKFYDYSQYYPKEYEEVLDSENLYNIREAIKDASNETERNKHQEFLDKLLAIMKSFDNDSIKKN